MLRSFWWLRQVSHRSDKAPHDISAGASTYSLILFDQITLHLHSCKDQTKKNMPLFLAASVKSAVILGALIGCGVAVATNDKVLEFTAEKFQKWADELNKHLREKRQKIGTSVASGVSSYVEELDFMSGVTTPAATDEEYEESDFESDREKRDLASGSFEIIHAAEYESETDSVLSTEYESDLATLTDQVRRRPQRSFN